MIQLQWLVVRKESYETSHKGYDGRDSGRARLCGTVEFGIGLPGRETGVGWLPRTSLGLAA